MGFKDRLAHAWNAFAGPPTKEVETQVFNGGNVSYGVRTSRTRSFVSNERSIIASIYNRIGLDVASVVIRHIRRDAKGRYLETMPSQLNECLLVAPNIDQTASPFKQDIAMTLFEKGVIAIVPVETTKDPAATGSYDILSLRVGEITQWYPQHVKVKVWNEITGKAQEIIRSKSDVAIVENPLYAVMNESNSTLQRIIRKLNLLDAVDEAASSGKLDIIIQLPYTVKTDIKRDQAERRRSDIETQLVGSKYGIAYIDSTEKITQLNRPAENNMLAQVKWLTEKLYAELGLSPGIFDGTASETEMLNYNHRTVERILTAITESMHRTFLTKTARTQGQAIEFFRDMFKLVPVSSLAEIGDKFTRNAILSSNEMRSIIGFTPVSDDPEADKLTNKNLPTQDTPSAEVEPIELKQINP